MHAKLNYTAIQTPNGQVGYIKLGQGQPLVLINRYAATLYNWDKTLIAELAKVFTIYLLEARGIGYSYSTNPATITGYAKDMLEAILALGLIKPILLGWSFGGAVVQEIYQLLPQLIKGIILLSSFADAKLANAEFVNLSLLDNNSLTETNKLRLYELLYSEPITAAASLKLKDCALLINNYPYRFTAEGKKLHNQLVLSWNGSSAKNLAKIKVPSLIIKARNDMIYPLSAATTFLTHIPNSKLIAYPSGGHLLIHKHALAITQDIINYFTE